MPQTRANFGIGILARLPSPRLPCVLAGRLSQRSSMHPVFLPRGHSAPTIPVTFVNSATWREQRERLDARERAFADAAGFEPKTGRHLLLPAADGGLAGALFALEPGDEAGKDLFLPGALSGLLPAGAYRFANAPHDSKLA